jgi:hypothetical protein
VTVLGIAVAGLEREKFPRKKMKIPEWFILEF